MVCHILVAFLLHFYHPVKTMSRSLSRKRQFPAKGTGVSCAGNAQLFPFVYAETIRT